MEKSKIYGKEILTDILIFVLLVYRTSSLPFIFTCLFFTMLFRLLTRMVKVVDENTFMYIVAVVLASKLIFKVFYFSYPDSVAILLSILALMAVNNRIFKWGVPVLFIIAAIINEGVILYFAPVIVCACLYEDRKTQEIGTSILYYIFIAVSLSLSLRYLDIGISGDLFGLLINTARFVLPVLPVLLLFVLLWIKSYKSCQDKTIGRILVFCLLQPMIIFVVIGAFIHSSFNPNTIFLTQFCLLFYFLARGEAAVSEAITEIKRILTAHFIIQFLPLAYLLRFGDLFRY